MVEEGGETTLEAEEEVFPEEDDGISPANVTDRGENQNSSHPSGQRFDK